MNELSPKPQFPLNPLNVQKSPLTEQTKFWDRYQNSTGEHIHARRDAVENGHSSHRAQITFQPSHPHTLAKMGCRPPPPLLLHQGATQQLHKSRISNNGHMSRRQSLPPHPGPRAAWCPRAKRELNDLSPPAVPSRREVGGAAAALSTRRTEDTLEAASEIKGEAEGVDCSPMRDLC